IALPNSARPLRPSREWSRVLVHAFLSPFSLPLDARTLPHGLLLYSTAVKGFTVDVRLGGSHPTSAEERRSLEDEAGRRADGYARIGPEAELTINCQARTSRRAGLASSWQPEC